MKETSVINIWYDELHHKRKILNYLSGLDPAMISLIFFNVLGGFFLHILNTKIRGHHSSFGATVHFSWHFCAEIANYTWMHDSSVICNCNFPLYIWNKSWYHMANSNLFYLKWINLNNYKKYQNFIV